MATSVIATTSGGAPKLRQSFTNSTHRCLNPTTKFVGFTKFLVSIKSKHSGSSLRRQFAIQAKTGQESPTDNDTDAAAFTSQEDVNYLWKLGAGSFLGAAVIKYGSILFPEITRPNIWQALIMITTPVLIAVWLLIQRTRAEQRS